MSKPIIVVAVGGNALLQRGEVMSCENQKKSIAQTAGSLAELSKDYRLVVVHGNGPQVGLLSLQNNAYKDCPPYPFDVLGAETQGMIGYLIQQGLNAAIKDRFTTTILTRIVIDENDPAIADPAKFIGPIYTEEQAKQLAEANQWVVKPDGTHWRRVVPSPSPKEVLEIKAIKDLLEKEHLIICGGGGGAPVVEKDGAYVGFEAVIDKDMTAALIAEEIGAEHLLILTDGSHVCLDWGTPKEEKLENVSVEQMKKYTFPAGSMGPKVDACCLFVEKTKQHGHIGDLSSALEIIEGKTGTHINA
ncbi:carbamate kinase [Vibrio lentus]|uniref:Carbamate kinase n=1 Tax=Vibrio lentus TaxID=136468 RepID=A0AB36XFV5_9VIBR|nr:MULTISPECIES: carbamate kinase [Vibrio]MCC4837328.1 carbamate kinase [Vibrio lentus]MDN2666090.1 carbamate kinase [Vibrio sp. 14N.309.X.WAT.E.F5]PMI13871.1 carbamate kinase [Vibrio lentus]PMK33879.1 carbamate kinase [Vibrio lentus]PMK39710.1 carbamate kinase [Vibrio lentus]